MHVWPEPTSISVFEVTTLRLFVNQLTIVIIITITVMIISNVHHNSDDDGVLFFLFQQVPWSRRCFFWQTAAM